MNSDPTSTTVPAARHFLAEKVLFPFIIFFASFLPFILSFFGGLTIGPWSQIQHMAPWNGAQPTKPWDVLQMDSVLQFFGWRQMVFQSWAHGQVPWWNPYILSGTPLLANSQSGALYPPHIVMGLLHISTGIGILLLAALHLAWAGLGCYFLVLSLNGKPSGALLAGLGLAFSSFFIGWLPLSSVVETVSWIPWILLFTQKLVSGERKFNSTACLAGCFAMMILAGHLQFAFYGFLAAFVWAITGFVLSLFQAKSNANWNAGLASIGLFTIALIGAAFIARPQLKPVLDLGHQSHRQSIPSSDRYQAYIAGADKWTEVAAIANPGALGLPSQAVDVGGNPLSTYWPGFVYRGSSFAETAFSLGPIILAAILLGLGTIKLKTVAPCIAVGAVGLLLAFGTPLNAILYFGVPGWSATGSPGRAACLFVVAGCVIAGVALPEVGSEISKKARQRAFLIVAGLSILGLPLMVMQSRSILYPQLQQVGILGLIVAPAFISFLIAIILAGALCWLWSAKAIKPKISQGVLVGLILIQPLVLYPVLRFGKPELPASAPLHTRIAMVNPNWNLLVAPKSLAPPNTLALSQIHTAGGYDSLIRKEAAERLKAIDGEDASPPENGNMMFIKPNFDPTALANDGVTQVWSLAPLSQLNEAPQTSSFGYIYNLPGPGRVTGPNNDATILSEDSQSVSVEGSGPGPLILRDDLQPDWQASIDGNLHTIQFAPWPTVQLPAGRHQVRFFSSDAAKTQAIWWVYEGGGLVIILVSFAFDLYQTKKVVVQ